MAGFFERLANMIDEEVSKAGANGNTASVPAAAPKKPVTWNEFLEQTGKDIDQQSRPKRGLDLRGRQVQIYGDKV